VQHLDKTSRNAFRILKNLSDYKREEYKGGLRTRVIDLLHIDPAAAFAQRDDTLRSIKRKFNEIMGDRPFYAELVDEILKEDYAAEGQRLRDEILQKLRVEDKKPKTAKQEVSFKSTLMDGLRALGMLNMSIDDAMHKLEDNSLALESTKNSFLDKLRRFMRKVFNREPEAVVYEVEMLDPISGIAKSEKVDFTAFKADVDRKSRLLAAFNNRSSTAIKKLEAATEDQVQTTLAKHLEELQTIHKTMAALDAFFKTSAPEEIRTRVKGIKPELSGIKNGIVKANQKRHEYVAQKEELEQMKRLGIRGDEA